MNELKFTPTKLDTITAAFVLVNPGIGIFHYNKLAYLFEYLYIKNFGERYTREYFIKLPHGPVISGYKKQIKKMSDHKIFDVDMDRVQKNRNLKDDFGFRRIEIYPTDYTESIIPENGLILKFISSINQKYGSLSAEELEDTVYNTLPVIKYQRSKFKKRTGGYVLKNECLRLKDHNTVVTRGRKKALEHMKKHPDVNFEQQKTFRDEFRPLENMRPVD